jgi:hypothetical protein
MADCFTRRGGGEVWRPWVSLEDWKVIAKRRGKKRKKVEMSGKGNVRKSRQKVSSSEPI